jgi:hypothetical protein
MAAKAIESGAVPAGRVLAYYTARHLLASAPGHPAPLPEDILPLAQWLTGSPADDEPAEDGSTEDDEPEVSASTVALRDQWPPVVLAGASRLALLGMTGLFALFGLLVFIGSA